MKFERKTEKVALMLISVLLLATFTAYATPLTWTETGPVSKTLTVYGDFMQEESGGRIWMIYNQYSGVVYFIAYKTSDDGGATWSNQVNISDYSGTQWFFGSGSIIKAANGNITLIYVNDDRDIVLRSLVDFGTNAWTAPRIIFDGSVTNGTCHPDACVLKDGTIIVVFHEKVNATRTGLRTGEDIWGIKSTDHGETWSAPFLVYTDGPAYDNSDQLPTIAQTCDGTVHVVFSAGGMWYQVWTISPDGGNSWMVQGQITPSAPTLLNNELRQTVDGGLALVYQVQRATDTETNVYITFYDQGVWTTEERVTNKATGETMAQRPYVIQINGTANDRKMLVGYRWDPTDARGAYYSLSTETVSVEHAVSRNLTITTTVNGTTDPSPGAYVFPNGTLATIEAIPDNGSMLDHWELNGSNIGATNPMPITMNASYTLHAVFSTAAVHDVAVIGKVTFSSKHGPPGSPYTPVTECYPPWTVEINVTVQNQGNYTETFSVKVFYGNATGNYTLGISPASYSVTLDPGASANKTFTWDAPEIPKVFCTKFFAYTIYANASVVPGETDTSDNIRDGVVVKVKWPGDGNGDGLVGLSDLMILSMSYKKSPVDVGYNLQADFNGDGGQIGLPDLMILSMNYRKGPCDT